MMRKGDRVVVPASGLPEYAGLSVEQLLAAFDAEVERDPWVMDWGYGHPGRRLRCEMEIRAGRITLRQAKSLLNGKGCSLEDAPAATTRRR